MRLAVTIFLLTQRSRLGEPFRYLEHVRKVHRKVSRGFSKKVFAQKNEVLSEYSILILSFIFKKSQLFSLFLTYNLIGVSYGHDNTANFSKRSLENECNYLDLRGKLPRFRFFRGFRIARLEIFKK